MTARNDHGCRQPGRTSSAARNLFAQERFRLAFHGAPTGMALSSADTGVLIDVNESLASMLGYAREEMIGRNMQSITHPDDWQRGEIHTVGVGVDSYHMEQRYIRNDQSVMWARVGIGDGRRRGALPGDHPHRRHHRAAPQRRAARMGGDTR